jgi:ABC-type polar amino acid transport system ATPase subunit
MQFARQVSSRIAFMAEGEILEDEPPDVFFTSPKHPLAQDFVARVFR